MNDRIGVNRDSAETEASVKSTEASAETSAESLPINWSNLPLKLRKIIVVFEHQNCTNEKVKHFLIKHHSNVNQLVAANK